MNEAVRIIVCFHEGISFYIGAIKRNKKGCITPHTNYMYYLLFLYYIKYYIGLKLELSAQAGRFEQQIQRMNRNLGHIRRGMMVGQRQRPAAAATTVVDDRTGPDGNIVRVDNTAKLLNHPKTLSILWREYMFGVGRNKPARDFTTLERNTKDNKNVYTRRKPFWLLVGRMTNAGWNDQVACEMIQETYTIVTGKSSMTAILDGIRKDASHKPNPIERGRLSVLPRR